MQHLEQHRKHRGCRSLKGALIPNSRFMNMDRLDKFSHLRELAQIVAGIRWQKSESFPDLVYQIRLVTYALKSKILNQIRLVTYALKSKILKIINSAPNTLLRESIYQSFFIFPVNSDHCACLFAQNALNGLCIEEAIGSCKMWGRVVWEKINKKTKDSRSPPLPTPRPRQSFKTTCQEWTHR